MLSRVLLIDDDPNVLAGYRRHLRKKYDLETTDVPEDGVKMMQESEEYAVILSDMQMPGMNGVEVLKRARHISPNSTRLMLTGNADQETATRAINDGAVFRFLNKPCSPEDMATAIDTAVEQHRLITAEKQLLEQTLKGSVDVLTDILSLVNPVAFGKAKRLHDYVSRFCEHLSVERPWELEIAAMLSQLGCVTIPEDILKKAEDPKSLDAEERAMVSAHPEVAANLIRKIPRLDGVASLIESQFGDDTPKPAATSEQARQCQVLRAAATLESCITKTGNCASAITEIKADRESFDEDFQDALEKVVQSLPSTTRTISFSQLARGMVLAAALKTTAGQVLLGAGQTINDAMYVRVQNFSHNVEIAEPILVFEE